MPKDPFKPIQAETINPTKKGYVRRAPIENIMWSPKNPKQLGEALATIVNELHPKALSWFWRELTSSTSEGETLKEQTMYGAVDQHFSMFPGGSAAFTPYYDAAEEAADWGEDEVFPAYMRDFRNLMIKRPDLPMTAKADGTGTLRRLDRLPQTTAELTAVAYEYGASVPQHLVGSLWNRAQTLLGDALLQPEWVWEPAPIGNFHESEVKNAGHPLVGDGSEVDEPVSELGTTTANAGNYAAKGKITDTGKVMKENKKQRQRVTKLFNRLYEELSVEKVFEEDVEEIDVFGEGDLEGVSEEDLDALIDASNMKRTQDFLGTESTVKVVQATGRALGKMLMLMGDEAQQQLDEFQTEAAKEFVLQGVKTQVFSKADAKDLAENLELVKELDSFRNFFDIGFLHPAYLRWRGESKKNVRSALETAGVPEKTIGKIEGRVDRAEVFAAEGVPEEGIFKALGGHKAKGSKERTNIQTLSKRVWRAIQETVTSDLLDASLERWQKLSKNKKASAFAAAFADEED